MAAIASAVAALLGRQHERILRLRFPRHDGPPSLLLPERLDAEEALSRDFEFRVTLLSEDAAIPAKSLVGKMATIELVRADGSLRHFNGYVFEFGRAGTDGGLATYRMVLRPWMALLRHRRNSGPFPETTVAGLTATILGRYEFHDYDMQLRRLPDPALTRVMQWQESDANFLHRWWEERGWYYRYDHREGGHTLVLCDDSTAAEPIHGNAKDCRVRVATPMAGDSFGFVAIPRIGQEVIIKKGEEQLWLHAERNQDIEVEHDETHWVGNDRTKTIDRDETVHVKRDRTEVVDRNENITVHTNREERVDHDERISIGDHRTEDVGKNETIFIGQNRTKTIGSSERHHIGHNKTVNIGRFKTETIGMASLQTVGMGKMTNVGLGYNRNVGLAMISVVGLSRTDQIGTTWSLTAGDKIELKVGRSQLTLTPDAIYLSAKDIHLKAENEVHVDAPKDINLNSGTAQPPPGFDGQGGTVAGVAGAAVGVAGLLGNKSADHTRVKEENAKRGAPAGATPGVLARTPSPGDGSEAEAPEGAAVPAAVTTGLGADVDAVAAQSVSLQADLQQLQQDGWLIEYGPAGEGSFADRESDPPMIAIDGNLRGSPLAATKILSHEVGHATYPYVADFSSKDAYVNGALADEGAAMLANIEVQREILAAGGPDILLAGSQANHAAYNAAYDQFLQDGDAGAARQAIGRIFASGETPSGVANGRSYYDYYGDWYDEVFGSD